MFSALNWSLHSDDIALQLVSCFGTGAKSSLATTEKEKFINVGPSVGKLHINSKSRAALQLSQLTANLPHLA